MIIKAHPDVGYVVRCLKKTALRIGGSGFRVFFFFCRKAIAAHYDARFDSWGLLVAISLPDLLSGGNVTGICPGSSGSSWQQRLRRRGG